MPVGPHEGKELALMLAGKKHLAAFGDLLPDDGEDIPEDIIPEKAFASHVAAGTILRFAKTVPSPKLGGTMFYVCYTLPGHEWRAATYLWLREAMHSGIFPPDDACDIMIGRLLGYGEGDIEDFASSATPHSLTLTSIATDNNVNGSGTACSIRHKG